LKGLRWKMPQQTLKRRQRQRKKALRVAAQV